MEKFGATAGTESETCAAQDFANLRVRGWVGEELAEGVTKFSLTGRCVGKDPVLAKYLEKFEQPRRKVLRGRSEREQRGELIKSFRV